MKKVSVFVSFLCILALIPSVLLAIVSSALVAYGFARF